MLDAISPLTVLRTNLASGLATPATLAERAILAANGNAGSNTYLDFHSASLRGRAQEATKRFGGVATRPTLYGIPVSLKDCFDLAGTVTTCGSRFYAQQAAATADSALATAIAAAGALVTGKTHLHPLAYGITGQNAEYGDCLQPRDATLLTGGSSSGAAASVQEGSAVVAIGTDTGGSIRVPAALCGLAGYRLSRALAYQTASTMASPKGLWAGAAHLAPSFDTLGFLVRDPRDLAPVAQALFGLPEIAPGRRPRIGCVPVSSLADAQPEIVEAYAAFQRFLALEAGALEEFDAGFWEEAREIFFPLQAAEAAAIHAGHFDRFGPQIAERLRWGASLAPAELAELRERHRNFRAKMASLFAGFDFLVLPCAPVSRLAAAEDQSASRNTILRYTTPFSLAGVPVVALPGEVLGAPFGTGLQLAAAAGEDAALLDFAMRLGERLASG